MSALGAVLAGGRSRRFGSDKAMAELGARTLLERAVATLRDGLGGADVVVVSSRPLPEVAGAARIADRRPARGPLAGIEAALLHARTHGYEEVFLLACDLPLVTADMVRALVEARGQAAAVAPGRREPPGFEPLCACYASTCVDDATRLLDQGRGAAHELFTAVGGCALPVAETEAFANVNTPADLEAVRRALEGLAPGRRSLDAGGLSRQDRA